MNMTDNTLLLAQMFTAQGESPSTQAKTSKDGSSFREMVEQRQSTSGHSSTRPAQKPAQDKAEAPQDAPAQNPEESSLPQTQTPGLNPTDTTILVGLTPEQLTVESAVVPTIPNTPQAIAFVQKYFAHSYGQVQEQTTAQTTGQTAIPQEGRTLPQAMQAQQPIEPQAETQAAVQPIQPKAEAQPKQQSDLGMKGLANDPTALSTGKEAVKQGEEAPAQPLFRQQLEGTPIKVGETQTADTTAPNFEQQLAKQVSTALEKGAQRVEIQLTPEHLGKLTIELTRAQDGSMRIVLHASTERAANLLSEHSSGLASLLRGNSQASVQVEVQQQNQEHGQREEQQQQGNQQQHQQQRQQQQTQDFLQQLRLGILPLESEAS